MERMKIDLVALAVALALCLARTVFVVIGVEGLGFNGQGLGFRVEGLRFRV